MNTLVIDPSTIQRKPFSIDAPGKTVVITELTATLKGTIRASNLVVLTHLNAHAKLELEIDGDTLVFGAVPKRHCSSLPFSDLTDPAVIEKLEALKMHVILENRKPVVQLPSRCTHVTLSDHRPSYGKTQRL